MFSVNPCSLEVCFLGDPSSQFRHCFSLRHLAAYLCIPVIITVRALGSFVLAVMHSAEALLPPTSSVPVKNVACSIPCLVSHTKAQPRFCNSG